MYSDKFERAFSRSLSHEGGFVNDSDDAGGATKYGISLRTYGKVFPIATVETIKNLTIDDAKKIYLEHFWLFYKYEQIEDFDLSIKVFDAAINMGAKQAHICLQRALRAVGFELEEDGVIGKNTLAALNRTQSSEWNFSILCAFRSELAGFYRLLVEQKPQCKKFLKGWLNNRAYS